MSGSRLDPLRQALWPLSLLYGVGTVARNWAFDAGLRKVHRLPVPVTSVGNLVVGGTGKTPAVLWLAERARQLGFRPGVLARGYGRAAGARLNDEGELLQRRLPWLLQEQDPDRVEGGRRLLARGADLILLDDGFQHRRLYRNADVVCVDAERPFADGQLLPAGDLREPRSGLRRADVLLLTRAGGLSAEQVAERTAGLRRIAGKAGLPVFACEHAPLDLVREPGGEVSAASALAGRRLVLLVAVARPASVEATVRRLGGEVVRTFAYRDHHRFRPEEVATAAAAARSAGALLVTTEKDAARLQGAGEERWVLRIALRFLGAEPGPEQLGWR